MNRFFQRRVVSLIVLIAGAAVYLAAGALVAVLLSASSLSRRWRHAKEEDHPD